MSQPQQLPAGWDDSAIKDLAHHYDSQTEDEQAAEIEAALQDDGITMVAVPSQFADEVRALIALRQSA